MKHIFIALVKFYQKFISPSKPSCCRFTPTCSEYSVQAFSSRGAIVGFVLTVWRILRCNPLCRGGYDPVPLKGEKRTKRVDPYKDTLYLSDKANGRK